METTQDPYEAAVNHLVAARDLLAAPAAHARALAESGSPHAQSGAVEARNQIGRMGNRLRAAIAELGYLEENLAAAQDSHDRHEQVNHPR